MTPLTVAGLVIAAVLAFIDWFAVARGDVRLERLAKPAVIAPLIVVVLLSDPEASTRSLLLAVALGASLTGDLLLLPPGRFLHGLAAFFVAHVAFLAAFALGPLRPEPAAIGAVAAVAVGLIVGRIILAGSARAGLRSPVGGYLGAILLMAVAATASGSPAAAVGAWLFVTSDAILGWDRFVAPPASSRRTGILRRLAIIVPYHGAQLLLTASLLAVI